MVHQRLSSFVLAGTFGALAVVAAQSCSPTIEDQGSQTGPGGGDGGAPSVSAASGATTTSSSGSSSGGSGAGGEGGSFTADNGCHAISTAPFVDVDLKTGTGPFGADADPGSESWSVQCPAGVSPCPAPGPNPPSDYKPLQSGEYEVTYSKSVTGQPASCHYPLLVTAGGLRIELTWEHPVKDGVDLDLHLHGPDDTSPWVPWGATAHDCGYANCKASSFCTTHEGYKVPRWFSPGGSPPEPVNWDDDPGNDTCYFAPRGEGQTWQAWGKGCHNPRLDSDTITCNPTITDPNDTSFCAPENINIDYPPFYQWLRIAVFYYSNHGLAYSVHPEVKVYCNGNLAADLGASGYDEPVTFTASQGAKLTKNALWLVGDVAFRAATPDHPEDCVVQPLYRDPDAMTPYTETPDIHQKLPFGPAYPPLPE